jgi:hypothetical protein
MKILTIVGYVTVLMMGVTQGVQVNSQVGSLLSEQTQRKAALKSKFLKHVSQFKENIPNLEVFERRLHNYENMAEQVESFQASHPEVVLELN